MVAGLLEVELVAHAGADGGDERLDLGVLEHLVDPALLDVEDLAAQRQDRLGVRSRRCLAEPPAESPSTTKSSASAGSLTEQSASLPGSERVLQRRLAPGEVARLARRLARLRGLDRLADDAVRPRGSPPGTRASLALTIDSTKPCMPGLPSLVFVWPSNCGSGSLAEMTAVRPSRTSSPMRFSSFSALALLARVAVERARQRRADPTYVCRPRGC